MVGDIKEAVERTVEENGLLERGDRIVVAVSGGADSVALFDFLAGERAELGLDLVAAHFNHRLRGGASDGDEAFVSSMAASRGIPFRRADADVEREARERGASVEETAREMRYAFLGAVAIGTGARKVALGHTADDLAETFLMRLLRGSGPSGLVPMEPMMERESVAVIRPLIEVSHAQVVRHLKEKGIPYRLDSSNYRSGYFRNRVRLELIPYLEREYNPAVRAAMAGAARGLAAVMDYVDGEVRREIAGRVDGGPDAVSLRLGGLHPAIASGVVRAVLRARGLPYSRGGIEEVLSIARRGRGRADIGGSYRAVGEGERVMLLKRKEDVRRQPAPIAVPGKTVAGPFTVETSLVEEARFDRSATGLARTWAGSFDGGRITCEAYLDYESLEKPLVLRNRRSGDRFQPTGMGVARKLKEILIDEKVPRRLRDVIPLLASGGDIAWVVGYRVGERFKVRPDSRKILRIKLTAEGENLW